MTTQLVVRSSGGTVSFEARIKTARTKQLCGVINEIEWLKHNGKDAKQAQQSIKELYELRNQLMLKLGLTQVVTATPVKPLSLPEIRQQQNEGMNGITEALQSQSQKLLGLIRALKNAKDSSTRTRALSDTIEQKKKVDAEFNERFRLTNCLPPRKWPIGVAALIAIGGLVLAVKKILAVALLLHVAGWVIFGIALLYAIYKIHIHYRYNGALAQHCIRPVYMQLPKVGDLLEKAAFVDDDDDE